VLNLPGFNAIVSLRPPDRIPHIPKIPPDRLPQIPNKCELSCLDFCPDLGICHDIKGYGRDFCLNVISACHSECWLLCRTCPTATICNFSCVDTRNDKNYCGGCENQCTDSEDCIDSTCRVTRCEPGYTACNYACVNTLTDKNNCGGCGKSCSTILTDSTCVSGQCQCTSPKIPVEGRCIIHP
jgi:hypothetical protein